MPSGIHMTTPISYLSETICSRILQEQGSMKWLVPSIIALSGEFPACARSIICISKLSSWVPTPSTLPQKLFTTACKQLGFFSLLTQRWTFCLISFPSCEYCSVSPVTKMPSKQHCVAAALQWFEKIQCCTPASQGNKLHWNNPFNKGWQGRVTSQHHLLVSRDRAR